MNALIREMAKPALLLTGFAIAGTLLLAGVHAVTEGQIAANERQALLERINTLVEPNRYDNDPLHDQISLPAGELHSALPVTVYRARKGGQPVAAVFVTTSPDGYSGNIRLAVGVNADQTLAGVRVVSHKETPGLGDRIDVEKSDWVHGFQGTSLQDPPENAWAVRKDGGHFDQFTGATITPRAIVSATKSVLLWSQAHADTLFSLPAKEAKQP